MPQQDPRTHNLSLCTERRRTYGTVVVRLRQAAGSGCPPCAPPAPRPSARYITQLAAATTSPCSPPPLDSSGHMVVAVVDPRGTAAVWCVCRGSASGGERDDPDPHHRVRGVERDGVAVQHGRQGRVRPGVRGDGAQRLPLRRPRRAPPLRGLRQLGARGPAPVPPRRPRLPRRPRPPDRARRRRALPLRLGPRLPDDRRRRARRLLLNPDGVSELQ
jgi:hypothetical protein